jgi:hypothetical protein
MGKTDWKAEAKALKKEIKALSGAKKVQKPASNKANSSRPWRLRAFLACPKSAALNSPRSRQECAIKTARM